MKSSSKRRLRATLVVGATASALILTGCASGSSPAASSSAAALGSKIVFASYGGSFTEAQTTAFYQPFAATNGLKMTVATGVGFPKLEAMEKAGNVTWDVVTADSATLPNDVASGLLAPLDTKVIDTSNINKDVVNKYGVGYILYSRNFGYNKEAFPGKTMTPADFFNPAIKARRNIMGVSPQGNLEFALLADGVSPSKLYPLDVDRAFKVLDRIKSQLVGENSQPETLVQQNEVDMTFMAGGRLQAVITAGAKWQLSWADNVSQTEYWAVPKNAPHKAAAMAFINSAIQPGPQAELAALIPYGPTNSKALPLIKPSLASQLPSYPANAKQGITLDTDWWAKNFKAVDARWTAWLAG
jgi:putative spermidine/putrescine transport system substrate-binding protein